MATPIVEQISVAVLAELAAISQVGGYQITIAEAVRPTQLGGFTPGHLSLLLVESDRVRVPELDANPPGIAWMQIYDVIATVSLSDANAGTVFTMMNQAVSSIEKAVMTDVTHGGLAIDTELQDMPEPIADDAFLWAFVRVGVMYRVVEDDPYTVRL